MVCPPRPDPAGSQTPSANAAATAASKALPPASSISTPAAVARWCAVATMPVRETARRRGPPFSFTAMRSP